jgi:hypothetical protein
MTVADIGLADAMRRLGATRAWALKEGYAFLGLVCEGDANEVEAVEIHRVKSGYLALIDLETILCFMAEAVRRANNRGAA